ncbi:V4R domain-containing protein [Oceanobacillus senegalensis]|uniref:V4R domain-containing protein n=1 Tax=Oceanobacillus senegalensis TaxID=1936063 RepID=UPI0015C45106|nr:V4R domain-containing protein [Oceanobacillus senegalensis]
MNDVVFDKSDSTSILMSTNAFLTLNNNLEKNIGSYKTKGFLFRFGKEFGMERAKNNTEKLSKKRKVGKMHTKLGHVQDVKFEGEIIRHPDGSIECLNTGGKWIKSFEAELYVKSGRLATEPVCHTLCGFASGALSYEFGESIIAVETKCVAKGDDCCEFEIRLEKDWLPEKGELISLYQNDNILSELEMTYDALLHHKLLLEKLSVFQTQLTQNVTEKYTMEELVEEAYRLLQIPIVVEDLHGNLLKQSGLDEDHQKHIQKNPASLIEYKRDINVGHYEGDDYFKVVSPVVINKKNYATCSLIYFSPKEMEKTDYLFLEKVSNVVALCMLYEEAQFGEQQRMRNSIVERLMHNPNIKSIESSFKFLPFPFQLPFSTAVLQLENVETDTELIDYQQQLMQLSKLVETLNLSTILAVIGDEIILVNSHHDEQRKFQTVCKKFLKKMSQQNPGYSYSLGLSRMFTELTDFKQALSEARVAQRFPNKQALTEYEELGMIGDVLSGMSLEQIHNMAKKTLKGLYDFKNKRKKELLHTLYIYLMNGQRIKETMDYLHLSIGGIQYRIKKIEELLHGSLKNAPVAAHILLIIQALILVGELEFDS